jgi:hypothetical protein
MPTRLTKHANIVDIPPLDLTSLTEKNPMISMLQPGNSIGTAFE